MENNDIIQMLTTFHIAFKEKVKKETPINTRKSDNSGFEISMFQRISFKRKTLQLTVAQIVQSMKADTFLYETGLSLHKLFFT